MPCPTGSAAFGNPASDTARDRPDDRSSSVVLSRQHPDGCLAPPAALPSATLPRTLPAIVQTIAHLPLSFRGSILTVALLHRQRCLRQPCLGHCPRSSRRSLIFCCPRDRQRKHPSPKAAQHLPRRSRGDRSSPVVLPPQHPF